MIPAFFRGALIGAGIFAGFFAAIAPPVIWVAFLAEHYPSSLWSVAAGLAGVFVWLGGAAGAFATFMDEYDWLPGYPRFPEPPPPPPPPRAGA